jgi:hypothetical protein
MNEASARKPIEAAIADAACSFRSHPQLGIAYADGMRMFGVVFPLVVLSCCEPMESCGGPTEAPIAEHLPYATLVPQLPPPEPSWVVITVGQAVAADTDPKTHRVWDPQDEHVGGDDCVTFSLLISLFGPPVFGKLAHTLCAADERQSAETARIAGAPDLAVWLYTGNGANAKSYATHTERDQLSPVFNEDFVVPSEGIPQNGSLHLRVYDMDGPKVVGDVLLSYADIHDASLTGRELLPSDTKDGHGLVSLGLTIRPYDGRGEHVKASIDTKDGTGPVTFTARESRTVRAGEVVELFASGAYKLNEDDGPCGGWVHPEGIVDKRGERCKEGNRDEEPFKSASRGVGVAIIGNANARVRLVVAPCASLVSSIAGPLMVGVNDGHLPNNVGSIDFDVIVRPPSFDEWATRRPMTPKCPEVAR